MSNYKIIVQYDGTNYYGWQIQKNSITIQQVIKDSIKIIAKEDVNLIGSGRTDTGVHALGQAANFKLEKSIDLEKFRYSLNCILPPDISIINIENVDDNFNARFDAKKRSYVYLVSKMKNPFFNKYSYFSTFNYDVEKLNKYSKLLLGINDYSCFCKHSTEVENKECNIINAHWKRSKNLLLFFIEADRFLHGMVRSITGTILYMVKNNIDEEKLVEIIQSKNRSLAGESVPSKGLFLFKVKYD